MLNKCEEQRRTAVHKNSKKYLASMAGYWEGRCKELSEDNIRLRGSVSRGTSSKKRMSV